MKIPLFLANLLTWGVCCIDLLLKVELIFYFWGKCYMILHSFGNHFVENFCVHESYGILLSSFSLFHIDTHKHPQMHTHPHIHTNIHRCTCTHTYFLLILPNFTLYSNFFIKQVEFCFRFDSFIYFVLHFWKYNTITFSFHFFLFYSYCGQVQTFIDTGPAL